MDDFSPSDLKTILHSKRANLYYLQHCRVLVNGGRVEYVTDEGKRSRYWNIPIANTTTLLLGTGTSVTQAAMRELAKAGVMVGFCGGGGTPLFSANEMDVEVAWFAPQSEYRPTEYLQRWVSFWFDDTARLEAARHFQLARLNRIRTLWKTRALREAGFVIDEARLDQLLDRSQQLIPGLPDTTALLTEEARLTKALFKLACEATGYGEFTRAKRGMGGDPATASSITATTWPTGWPPAPPGCWAFPTALPYCTARPGAAGWSSMSPTWSRTPASCRRPSSRRCAATKSRNSARPASTA